MTISSKEILLTEHDRIVRDQTPKKRVLKRPPKPVYPERLVIYYQNRLLEISNYIYEEIRKQLIPKIQQIVEQAQKATSDGRIDAEPKNLKKLMRNLNLSLDPTIKQTSTSFATDIGQKVSKWNDEQWQKTLRKVLGVNIIQKEPWLKKKLSDFTKDNVKLIKSLKDDGLKEVEQLVNQGIQSGVRHEIITKQIRAKYSEQIAEKLEQEGIPVTGRNVRRRAELIARDQVGKLNGDLSRTRQTEAGIEKYIWWDSGDRRVRDTHQARNGNTYSWTNPEHGGGHPGEEIQCRCTAEPVFTDAVYQQYAGR